MVTTTIEELTQVFRAVFDDDSIEITPEMTTNDLEKWDSITHTTLLLAAEDHFGVEFQPWEAMNLLNVQALVALIDKKRANSK